MKNPSHGGKSVVIRAATRDDLPLLLTLIKELAEYERLSHKVVSTTADLDRWIFGPHPLAHAVLAELNGMPVGYAVYFRYYSTFRGKPGMYLEDIYVRESARGYGVGEALICHVAAEAVKQHCTRLEWIVLDWNEPAIGFYRRMGASPEPKEWTTYAVSDDDLARLASVQP